MKRDTFKAIADPARREIFGIIAKHSLDINAVAGNFYVAALPFTSRSKY
ncbi:MAG: hypothetical protein ABJC98_17140 [Bacteroidota bacterium]